MSKGIALVASAAMLFCTTVHAAQPSTAPEEPWLNSTLSPDARAKAAVAAMTLDEKLRLIFGYSDQALTEVSKVPEPNGPGRFYMQTRSPDSFLAWLTPKLPGKRE